MSAVKLHRTFQSELKRFIYTKKSLNENFPSTEILRFKPNKDFFNPIRTFFRACIKSEGVFSPS